MKALGVFLLLVGVSQFALATATVPEINPAGASSALALLSGAILVIRGRKR
jgi:hypothetical protein